MREPLIGIALRSLSHLVMRRVENDEEHKRLESVTGTNGWIIGYLAENSDHDIFQKDLEAEFGITRSTASKVLMRMEKKGLLRRESVLMDGRLKKLTLTDRAWEIAGLMRQHALKMEALLLTGFSDAETQELLSYLRRMKANLTPPKENCL